MPCQTFFSLPLPFTPTGHKASSSQLLLHPTLSHTGEMENSDPLVNEKHKVTLARGAGATLNSEIQLRWHFWASFRFSEDVLFVSKCHSEWQSLWGERKDEIERRDWGRYKRRHSYRQRVGEMERSRETGEKCRLTLKLETLQTRD